MGVTGDTFNEGFKYMCHPIQLIDDKGRGSFASWPCIVMIATAAARGCVMATAFKSGLHPAHTLFTGINIVAEGKGYWRVAGERMGTLGFTHWCGPKQYSWLEWLVPDDAPAVVVKSVDVRVNARHWVVEAMPVSAWPSHGTLLEDYTFLAFSDADNAGSAAASQPPKWIALHSVHDSSAAGADASGWLRLQLAPKCKALRLRFLEAAASAPGATPGHLAASIQLQVRAYGTCPW